MGTHMPKSRQSQVLIYATQQQRAELKALSARTRISQQKLLREGLNSLLAKYRGKETQGVAK